MHFSDYSQGNQHHGIGVSGKSSSTSNLQNPIVFYNTPGVYSVSLVTSNANGTDSVTYSNYINIASSPQNNPATVGDQRCGPGVVNLSATGSGSGTLRWWDAQGGDYI